MASMRKLRFTHKLAKSDSRAEFVCHRARIACMKVINTYVLTAG